MQHHERPRGRPSVSLLRRHLCAVRRGREEGEGGGGGGGLSKCGCLSSALTEGARPPFLEGVMTWTQYADSHAEVISLPQLAHLTELRWPGLSSKGLAEKFHEAQDPFATMNQWLCLDI